MRHIERHTVCARIQIHLMQIRMYIDVCHDAPAERIILQIVDHAVNLIHHAFLVPVLHAELVTVCFSDGAVRIRPLIPDRAV